MVSAALIDLFVPAHLAEPDILCRRAAEAGLDGLVIAFDAGDDTPTEGELHDLRTRFGVAVHVGRSLVAANGLRLLVLGVENIGSDVIAAVEATGNATLMRAALHEIERDLAAVGPGRTGFAVVRIGLRQGPGRTVERAPVPLDPADAPGVVAILAEGSILARDLDCETLGESNIPMLAASGPFARLDDIGRFATALPVHAADHGAIARALRAGHGIAVEMVTPRRTAGHPTQPQPDPFEGRDKEAPKRRKRPRKRKGKGPAAPTGD